MGPFRQCALKGGYVGGPRGGYRTNASTSPTMSSVPITPCRAQPRPAQHIPHSPAWHAHAEGGVRRGRAGCAQKLKGCEEKRGKSSRAQGLNIDEEAPINSLFPEAVEMVWIDGRVCACAYACSLLRVMVNLLRFPSLASRLQPSLSCRNKRRERGQASGGSGGPGGPL